MIFLAGSVSAGLCKDSDGYYSECKPFNHRYVEDTNSKSVGDIRPDPPVFKGSYGSYRHDMYRNGDYKPNYYVGEYKTNSYPRSFNGGWGGGWEGRRGDLGVVGSARPGGRANVAPRKPSPRSSRIGFETGVGRSFSRAS